MEASASPVVVRLGEPPRLVARGTARCLAYSPDGKQLAARASGYLQVWDSISGFERLKTYCGEGPLGAASLAFSDDGNAILSGGATVDLWSTSSGDQLRRFAHDGGFATFISPDDLLFMGGTVIERWDVRPGARQRTLLVRSGEIRGAALSPTRTEFAFVAGDGALHLVQLESGRESWCEPVPPQDAPTLVAFSPDGRWVAVADRLLSVATGKRAPHKLRGKVLAFSADGTRFACGDRETVRLQRMSDGKTEAVLEGFRHPVRSAAFAPDGGTLAVGDERTLSLWDLGSGQPRVLGLGERGPVLELAFSSDGRLASGEANGVIRVWNVDAAAELERKPCAPGMRHLSFAPDGSQLRHADGKELHLGSTRLEMFGSIAASLDGRWFYAVASSDLTSLVDASTGQQTSRVVKDKHIAGAAMAPAGQAAAYWTGHRIVLVSVPSLEQTHQLMAPDAVGDVAFSPDGAVVAAACGSQLVTWSVATGKKRSTFDCRLGIDRLSFCPDGRTLAFVDSAGRTTIYLLRLDDGEIRALAGGHGDSIATLAWSADGKRLATGGRDQTIVVWDPSRAETASFPADEIDPHVWDPKLKKRLWDPSLLGRLPPDVAGRWDADLQDLLERFLRGNCAGYQRADRRQAEVDWLEWAHAVGPVDEWRPVAAALPDDTTDPARAIAALSISAEKLVALLHSELPELLVSARFSLPLIDAHIWERSLATRYDDPQLVEQLIDVVGAYLGEELVRRLGGRWIPRQRRAESQVVVGARAWLPFVRARRFLSSRGAALEFSLTKLFRVAEREGALGQ